MWRNQRKKRGGVENNRDTTILFSSSRNRAFHRAKTPTEKNETMEKGLEIDFVELRIDEKKRKKKKRREKKD